MKRLAHCTKKLAVIYGTRPELIKIAPLINNTPETWEVLKICTGQHRDLLRPLHHWFGFEPDIDMGIMRDGIEMPELLSEALKGLNDIFAKETELTGVLVQGDTLSAYAGGMTAFLRKIPVIHLEAGLRSFQIDNPFPEEMLRRQLSLLSYLHLAPSDRAVENLRNEGFNDRVCKTGNTVIDSLRFTLKHLQDLEMNNCTALKDRLSQVYGLCEDENLQYILVTMHRRENFGDCHREVCRSLLEILNEYKDTCLLFPVHPNPQVQLPVREILGELPRVQLLQPLNYLDMVWLLGKVKLLLTDSGGLQEEATSLGLPTLILRDQTERPEAVESGVATLVGTDKYRIIDEARKLLSDDDYYTNRRKPSDVFGDGKSASRSWQAISENLEIV